MNIPLFRKRESKVVLGLDRMKRALELLGNPHKKFPSVLIAGTVGKGHVASLVAEGIEMKCGLYTSPHLIRFTERIKIDGEEIPESELARLSREVEKVERKVELTYFEHATCIAFLWFAENQVEFAVLEVGLGGRLDATNVVEPEVSVITFIGFDHENYLGNSISEIAREKAGIIREVAVTGTEGESLEVIRKSAKKCFVLGEDFSWGKKGDVFLFSGLESLRGKTDIVAPAGLRNLALAVETLLLLNFKVNPAKALKGVKWPGRFHIVDRFILDGAHNELGACALYEFLEVIGKEKITFIVGMLSDKRHADFIRILKPKAKKFIFTKPTSDRAKPPEHLARFADGIVAKDLRSALDISGDGEVCITGSLYLVGEALKLLGNLG